MYQQRITLADEAVSGELDLLRIDSDRLRTAVGFVYGGMLSCAAWSLLGVLTWLVA